MAATKTTELLSKLTLLPPLQCAAVGTILGSAVADAAARPLHWIYDQTELDKLFQQNRVPEFWPESRSPFYTLPTGARSCYNHVLMAGLEAFTEAQGEVDLEIYKKILNKNFGAGTEWQEALERRREAYSPAKRKEWREPVEGPWLHGAVIYFLEHGEGEKKNTEMDAFLLTVAHLVFKAEDAGVVEDCLKIASLLSGQTDFVEYQLQVLRHVLINKQFLSSDIDILRQDVRQITQDVFDKIEDDHVTTVAGFGNNCHLPGSYQGALHAFIQNTTSQDSFAATIRDVIRAGGCNCSRGNYAGALVGAREGVQGIPTHWIGKVTGIDDILEMAMRASNVAV